MSTQPPKSGEHPDDNRECSDLAESNLSNHFLIAMPGLNDSNFAHSVTLICEHNAEGAMGIVINQPLDLSVGEIFEHLQIDSERDFSDEPVMAGGLRTWDACSGRPCVLPRLASVAREHS